MKTFLITVFGTLMAAAPVFALSLEEAKSQGQVGETPSGYLELVTPAAPAEAIALMNEINAKRRAEYQEIAQKNATPLGAVEALAGKKAIERTPPGKFIKVGASWVKK